MKTLVIGLILLISPASFSQIISGQIVAEGREVRSNTPFVIEGMLNGYCTYELSVDRDGKVTNARLVDTNLKSTPAKYEVHNYVSEIKFEPGTYYPKFHYALVKITTLKRK